MKLALAALLAAATLTVQAQPPATTTLQALRDHQRVLLVFGNGNNVLAEQQLTIASEHGSDFRQRDLLLVGLSGSNDTAPTALLSGADDAAARRRFHVPQGQFTVILLGKDGGEKLRSRQPIPWDTLRVTIDGMPMRQSEMTRQPTP